MNRHKHHTPPACWSLSVVLPILVASVTWLWTEATSGSGCVAGPGSPGRGGIAVLVLSVPCLIGWYANRRTGSATSGWGPMLVSTALAVPLVLFALLLWAGAHGCFS